MASTPQVGDPAPDFTLEGTEGPFRLADQRGRRVVLLFYPDDETPVCTRQFCSYRDRGMDFQDVDDLQDALDSLPVRA
jgi:peroxiredoxin Q/BCP